MILTLFIPTALAGAMDDTVDGNHVQTSAVVGAVVRDVQVVIDAPPEQQAPYAAMARQIIPIRPGKPLTDTAIQNTIEILKLSRRFSAIHVDSVSATDGESLIFTLTPYHYIKDIRIRGGYPLFEHDILNQMTIYPGDPYTHKDLSAQIGTIVERYKREGYIDPRVSVNARMDSGEEHGVIVVDIDKGPHFVLGALIFDGNRGISSRALKWRMKTWWTALAPVIGRFSEYRLKKDMDSLIKYYRRKGFADAELSYRIGDPGDSHRVNVTVRVREGRRYRVDFEGNQRFWKLTLKKDVVLLTGGNRGNVGVRKSVKKMNRRYREAGFLEPRIEVETTDMPGDPADLRQLLFVIEEGPQTIVDAVTITGNQTIDETKIKEQLLTRPPAMFHDGAFVPETLDVDVYAVTTLYMKQGFQERSVDAEASISEDQTGAAVSLKINEGPQTRVGSIAIHGLAAEPQRAAGKVLIHHVGDPFRSTALDSEKEAIASLVSEAGYPHATVESRITYNENRTRVDIRHQVDPGPQVTLEGIFIVGNLRTAEKVIRRELAVHPQTPLSLRTLHDGQRRLRDLDIFHGVNYRTFGLKEKEETVNLFVEVEENKPYYAQISGGYESDSGFFGRTAIGDRNLFGLNKDLWASGEISQTGYRVETRLTEPRLVGTRISASIGVFYEELTEFNQPFGTQTTGTSIGFGREWGKYLTTGLSFSLERRDQFSVDNQPTDGEIEEVRTIFITTPHIRYDSRDSFVRPTRGLFTSLGVDLSKGVQNQLDDFVRYLFDTRYYHTPVERITLAGLVRVGQVLPYSDLDRVPDDQLFFLGGIRDVRGFKENLLRSDGVGDPVGGRTSVVGSLEARIDLGLNLELTTFFDIGSVRNASVDEGSDRFRASVGLGLRYITPIGPMGLLYGHKLDRDEGEAAGRFHLSIGYGF